MKNKTYLLIVLIIIANLLLVSCASSSLAGAGSTAAGTDTNVTNDAASSDTVVTSVEATPDTIRPIGWSTETHSNETEPNYEVVFPQDEVNRLDITISPDNWQVMLDDMTALYGEFGAKQSGLGAGGQNQPPSGPAGGLPPQQGDQAAAGGNRPAGEGGLKEGDDSNPVWVPTSVEFEGDTWTNVGLRFKGNSSLRSSWGSGNYKLPFKLDFDEFENEYTEIDDQRFYGFKQLSLASNFNDSSFLHEKVAADIFRESGVPAAQTAFYQVYVDHGEGPIYFGLYTMVEVVDDTVIETQFDDDSGNVYKPDGSGASFAAGSFSEVSFDKETNQDEADYSDILALYQALHAETRTSTPETWRGGLEAVFDVDGFLQYLAVNTVIQNWDTYGLMSHNYYLYNDPSSGLLTWIPWDNNEAFKSGNRRSALSMSLDEVDANWPLISYLIDDPVYQAAYAENVAALIDSAFDPAAITARFQELHDLVAPYVVGTNGEIEGHTHLKSDADFDISLDVLIQHAENRYQAANAYLQSIR
jgi:spore coat protein H